ncbi:hypothetical protein CANTEDRAFT_108178 [Yamadazyma tenuis ATCC 10573]|uniref:E3 ubiquitin-protein ligase listerin n=2 Tax=Candida tenuis TaxID=2315449 RepID=G3BBG8_CANTC|nr:uncharacterized protein CANTEDRAFT_108178 [Yamadazyma tenuis ATCC 10573]EGV62188.1 hypothetical protein CANTEDRAFT_108178 [Yamadazyma tenuis ATCC 10573]
MDQDAYSSNGLLEVQSSLAQKFHTAIQTNLNECLDILLSKEPTFDDLVSVVVRNLGIAKGSFSSYLARLLRDVLDNLSEAVNVETFNTYNLEFNPLLKTPLKLAIVLAGVETLLSSAKFDKIRNYVATEILGVKDSDILTEGLKWVVLSINFLNAQTPDWAAIPPHRLNLILKQFEKWLDSDISYDDSFNAVRSQLVKFLGSVEADNKEDLVDRVIEDNFAIVQLERHYELTYFTLRYLTVHEIPNKDNLLDILFNDELNKHDNEVHNMAVHMCHDVLERCFDKLHFKDFSDKQLQQLYDLVFHSKFLQIKKICLRFLEEEITHKQQDLVINYQFQKDAEEQDIKLPPSLLKVLDETNLDSASETDSATYLICWYLVFVHFKDINYSIRNQYVNQIRSNQTLPKLLDYLFLVVEIDHIKIVDQFQTFDLDDRDTMLLNVFYFACNFLGSEVQLWFNELRNVQMKQDIDKFTAKNISKLLVSTMLEQVEHGKSKLVTDVMSLKINKVINEVRCVFEIDEQTMVMVIKIPTNFPLESVVVEGPKRVGLKENQWRAWLLSSQRVISLTNGSIIEAVEVFKKNVDLHFSGFEECAICYSILHQDHSLPSKNCSTCNNKFHAACLYKWFKSSGSSTCPLCRSTFNFRK